MEYTAKDFEIIKEFLIAFDIYYEEGNFYGNGGEIIGHWIEIKNQELESNELTDFDKKYNLL